MIAQDRARAPSPLASLTRARSRLELWGEVDARHLSEPLAESWRRCLDAKLDPLNQPENLVVEAGHLGRLLRQHSVLRRLARPELELLFGQVAGSNYMLALGTPEGIITDVLADNSFRETDAGKVVIEGSIWTERIRGTNGMGLAIADRAPRSVWRGEHFYRSQGLVSCISVPIFDSAGELAGVLDASTACEDWHSHTMALLSMSAANIEAGLFHYEQEAQTILRVHPRPEYLQTMSAGFVAVDGDGRIVAISRRAREILRVPESNPVGSIDDLLADNRETILGDLLKTGTVRCGLKRGGEVFVSSNHIRFRRSRLPLKPSLTKQPPGHNHDNAPQETQPGFVANDLRLRRQLDVLDRVVARRIPVHISGESGTGKELLARYIHLVSGRRGRFVAVSCAALTDENGVSELFGRHDPDRPVHLPGLAGAAQGGTLFLDEVDALPDCAQSALLRVMDTSELRPVGSTESRQIDIQIVSTRKEKAGSIESANGLRSDLLLRLNAFAITLPPLRERTDFEDLAVSLLEELSQSPSISTDALATLRQHDWPGNIRELRATLSVAVALCDNRSLERQDILRALPSLQAVADRAPKTHGISACHICRDSPLRRQRCINIRETYIQENKNAARTARALGIARSTLYEHIKGLRTTG